jgi:hypothetical protein
MFKQLVNVFGLRSNDILGNCEKSALAIGISKMTVAVLIANVKLFRLWCEKFRACVEKTPVCVYNEFAALTLRLFKIYLDTVL